MKRRMKRILKLSLLLLCFIVLSSCNKVVYENYPIYVFDTVVSLTFYQNGYEKHVNIIKNKLNSISKETNDFQTNSSHNSIYDLNEKRELEVSDDLINIINYSNRLMEETEGYFNPYMGRLNHKWKDAIKNNKILNEDEILLELDIIKSTSVEINSNTIKIIGEGNIDLGGIVKGYALEWTKNYLDENNITKYLLDFGSSSIYLGDYEQYVQLSKPYEAGYIERFKTLNMGIASSSGKHQNAMIDGVRYHHLINPFTGYPSNIYDAISVIGNIDNGILDAYSTAIFSMDENKAKEFIKNKNIELVTYKNGNTKHYK